LFLKNGCDSVLVQAWFRGLRRMWCPVSWTIQQLIGFLFCKDCYIYRQSYIRSIWWLDLIKTRDRLTLVTRPMVRKGHVFKVIVHPVHLCFFCVCLYMHKWWAYFCLALRSGLEIGCLKIWIIWICIELYNKLISYNMDVSVSFPIQI
jgi:hypothetical protein